MYVGITGTIGAGKGEVVRILKNEGFRHYGFGEFVREELAKQGKQWTADNMRDFADNLRKEHGSGHLAELLLRKAQQESPKHAVFESIRTLAELQTLRRLPGFILVSVDAPRDIRYERTKSRARGDFSSFEEFCAYDDQIMEGGANEQNIAAVMEEADVQIVNMGSLDELREQVEEQLNL